jgi:hypothetical protein
MNGARDLACGHVRAAFGLGRAGVAVVLSREVEERAVLHQVVARLGERAVSLALCRRGKHRRCLRDRRRSRCAKRFRSPPISMEAPGERLAYAVLLSRDRLKPDVLTVVGIDRRSANFGKTVDRLDMP